MLATVLSILLSLLPFPQQYCGRAGVLHLQENLSLEALIRTGFVPEIPEAGSHQEEAYRLHVRRGGIEIQAVTHLGVLRARQTLEQLVERKGGRMRIPCCEITDWAAFPYRGFMQDTGRSYLSPEELKTEIRTLARYKLNVFHWHLTENQAWRLECRAYPQLNAATAMTRFPGKFYTCAEVREIIALCDSLGMQVIPEIDMPGHSAAFERVFGTDMQSEQGMGILKEIVREACETFKGCAFFHIGTDEVDIYNPDFVPEMVSLIRSEGFKVISWNPGWRYAPGEIDAMQLWSYRGTAVPGIPAIDSKLHYLNHFDIFADLRNLHASKVCGREEGDADILGSEIAVWHDRFLPSEDRMVRENNFYPSALVLAERTWRGGDPLPFADFEARMLRHLRGPMRNLPVSYVRQSGVRWGITRAFPNGGDLDAAFPPETEEPSAWLEGYVEGAGIYLRHTWGSICPQFFPDPQPNSTAYAWTYVWSPKAQTVGLWVEFQNYSRSEKDLPPAPGRWDERGTRVWINDAEVSPPVWTDYGKAPDLETGMGNENFTARAPLQAGLRRGWNKVLLKLPVGSFSTPRTRLVKWMFTFVFVEKDGYAEVPGLVYSPTRNKYYK